MDQQDLLVVVARMDDSLKVSCQRELCYKRHEMAASNSLVPESEG